MALSTTLYPPLDVPLTIYHVGPWKTYLAELCAKEQNLRLDLGAAKSCDSAGIQLLCSAKKTAAARGKSFEIENASTDILNAFQALGLSPTHFNSGTTEEKL